MGLIQYGRRLFISGLLAMVFGAESASGQSGLDSAFARANAAFESGDFAGAERIYRELADAGAASEDLFYNLGNAVFRQNRYGEASLWYRRALVLAPGMPEAIQNLKSVRHRTGLLEFEQEGIDDFLSRISRNRIVSVLVGSAWATLLCLAVGVLIPKVRKWRTLLVIFSVFLAGVAGFAGWCLNRHDRKFTVDSVLVVTAAESRALTGPFPDAEQVIDLPEGSEVRKLRDAGTWVYVGIPGDIRGFVRKESTAAIVPGGARR